MYHVIACPRCRRARITNHTQKTTTCPTCNRTLHLTDLQTHHQTPNLHEAQHHAGQLNATLQGRHTEYLQTLIPKPNPTPQHDNRHHAAAAAARRITTTNERANHIARHLGDFDHQDLTQAFHHAGLHDPPKHLHRMLETNIIYEPKPGLYRALA